MKILLGLFLLFLITGCTENAPVEDYTLARSAVEAAQTASSNKYAPGLWFKAEEQYRLGETAFRKGDFDQAKEHFNSSQSYAERAENKARYEKRRLGEDLP